MNQSKKHLPVEAHEAMVRFFTFLLQKSVPQILAEERNKK